MDRFRFIPEWRLDDLMVSYAADQGSVGPHVDLYDVFLLQGEGKRRWQISTREVTEDNQVEGTPLRIQKEFTAEEEWIVEPGDMIYLPPGVSHHVSHWAKASVTQSAFVRPAMQTWSMISSHISRRTYRRN